jgi:hypothetical protein
MEEVAAQGEPVAERQPGALELLLDKRRLLVVAGVLLVELAIFFAATAVPMDATTQHALQNESNALNATTGSLGPPALVAFIFTHNAMIALLEMVPALGGVLWLFSIYATGQVISASAAAHGIPGPVLGADLLFLPFAVVELSAYAVSVASGTMLIAAWRRHGLRGEVRVLGLEACAVLGLLLTAATMETVTIINPYLGLSLWVPLGLVIAAGAWALAKNSSQNAKGPAAGPPAPEASPSFDPSSHPQQVRAPPRELIEDPLPPP